jgi:hypothetical protein
MDSVFHRAGKTDKKSNWHVIKSKGYKPGKSDLRLYDTIKG